jgi:hypothetical protein
VLSNEVGTFWNSNSKGTEVVVMTDNPARRLIDLLTHADGVGGGEQGRESYGNVWRRVLASTDVPPSVFLERFASVLELPEEVRATFVHHFGEDEEYLAWVPKLTNAFESVAMVSEWRSFRHHIDPVTRRELEFCANRLERVVGKNAQPNGASIKKLEDALADIANEAAAATGVDEDLRRFVVQRTGEVQAALLLVRVGVGSPNRVFRAIEAAAGACSPEVKEELARHTWGRRFLAMLKWVSLAGGAALIEAGVDKLLEAVTK